MDYNTFHLKDWEKDSDDTNLNKEEMELAIKEINSVDLI